MSVEGLNTKQDRHTALQVDQRVTPRGDLAILDSTDCPTYIWAWGGDMDWAYYC